MTTESAADSRDPGRMTNRTERNASFDGLRGIGAIIVGFWHFYVYFLPGQSLPICGKHTIASCPALLWLFNGPFMVSIFFVLSGRVLADGYYAKVIAKRDLEANHSMRMALFKRPIRLALPPYITLWIIYVLIQSDTALHNVLAFENATKSQIPQSAISSSDCRAFHGQSPWIFHKTFLDMFVDTFNFEAYHYKLMWTLHTEFYGSYLAYITAVMLARYKVVGTSVLMLLVYYLANKHSSDFTTLISHFACGLLLCHLHHHGLSRTKIAHASQPILLAMSLLIWGSYNNELSASNPIRCFLDKFALQPHTMRLVGAACTILWLDMSNLGKRVFTGKCMEFLGRISFSFYLLHGICFAMIGAFIVRHLCERGFSLLSAGAGFALPTSFLLTLPVSYAFTRLCDEPSIRFAHVCAHCLGKDIRQYFTLFPTRFLRVRGQPETVPLV